MSWKTVLTSPAYRLYEQRLSRRVAMSAPPRHIGVILDGHRRFSRKSGLPDYEAGYRVGMEKFVEFLHWCRQFDVPAVTCWLLSKENLARPADELEPYYDVLVDLFQRLPEQCAGEESVGIIGSVELLPDRLREAADRLVDETRGGSRRLTIALAYGGRQEIVDACRDLVAKLAANGLESTQIADHIDAEAIAANLYTADLPDPDLVIRTSGESRMSGFLLWQAAYAEYSFVDVYWPAFRRIDFLRALREFSRSERRFGL